REETARENRKAEAEYAAAHPEAPRKRSDAEIEDLGSEEVHKIYLVPETAEQINARIAAERAKVEAEAARIVAEEKAKTAEHQRVQASVKQADDAAARAVLA